MKRYFASFGAGHGPHLYGGCGGGTSPCQHSRVWRNQHARQCTGGTRDRHHRRWRQTGLLAQWAETEPQGMAIAAAIEAFTDETGVEVEVNFAGSRDTRKTLQPALDAGETIDVFDEDIERVNNTWGSYLLDIQAMYDASALNGAQNATLIQPGKRAGRRQLKACLPALHLRCDVQQGRLHQGRHHRRAHHLGRVPGRL